jgi:CRISPR-associated protein Cas5d
MGQDRTYTLEMEIAGATAMWSRPDSGATPVSYPVPTWSAVKGIFESVLRLKNTFIDPVAVEVCAPVKYHEYTTNYGGPGRKTELISRRESFQLRASVLVEVCYRLYARIGHAPGADKSPVLSGADPRRTCRIIFRRRLQKGQFYSLPCLGWREFVPSYVGPFRKETRVESGYHEVLPSFLYRTLDPVTGHPGPRYVQDPEGRTIRRGRLDYAQ